MMASEERARTVVQSLTDIGNRVRVRNAMNPILWLVGCVCATYGAVAVCAKEIPIAVTVMFVLVISVAVFGFLYMLFVNRDRLHSEDYLIRNQTLKMFDERATRKAVDAVMGKVLSRPEFLSGSASIPDDEEGQS